MRVAKILPAIVILLVACDDRASTEIPASETKPMTITYLKKANDDVLSFCSCSDGRTAFPAQMDCPWFGCGWLFSCFTCRKAFTFAVGVEIEGTWEDIAREDIRKRWEEEPSDEDVAAWVSSMKEILSGVKPGEQYVIIDGVIFHIDEKDIEFTGWYAYHTFAKPPQLDARDDRSVLDSQLGNRQYWYDNALPGEK